MSSVPHPCSLVSKKKRLACSHAVFTARKVIDFYCAGNSTVNVALLDMSLSLIHI